MFQSSPLRRAMPGTATFAFITHSPITLPNNLPPDVDNEPLARRRRRRTSQHDQSILEEEYSLNDRPDKYARREIMKRVDLGEREIQIWFQNRRQTSRRKSKPLFAHDLSTPNSKSRFDPSSDFVMSSEIGLNSDVIDVEDTNHSIMPSSRPSSPTRTTYHPRTLPDTTSPTASRSTGDEQKARAVNRPSEADLLATPCVRGPQVINDDTERKTSPIHFLLNVESEPLLPTPRKDERTDARQTQIPQSSPYLNLALPSDVLPPLLSSPCNEAVANRRRTQGSSRQPQLLKRSSSMIRLSMSMEGKATVVMEDEAETLPASLSSSQVSSQSTISASSAPERRVVDAKIWEICCDSQSSTPTNKVIDDSPRKTIKMIRARQVVAAAKEAATKRRKKTEMASSASKVLKARQDNPILAPKPSNKPMKAKAPSRLTEKLKAQARKSAPNTPKKPKADDKFQKPSLTSPLKLVESPFRLYSENSHEESPRKQSKSGDGADSDKENFDPDGRYIHQSTKEGKVQERRILGNIAPDVAAGEMECIENLLSLRGATWTS